jgi:hypothetical protein
MPEKAHKRIDDEDLCVSLNQEDFNRKAQELLQGEVDEEMGSQLDRIIYYRGELPNTSSIWVERLWWVLSIIVLLVFLYGLYSLCLKAWELLTI